MERTFSLNRGRGQYLSPMPTLMQQPSRSRSGEEWVQQFFFLFRFHVELPALQAELRSRPFVEKNTLEPTSFSSISVYSCVRMQSRRTDGSDGRGKIMPINRNCSILFRVYGVQRRIGNNAPSNTSRGSGISGKWRGSCGWCLMRMPRISFSSHSIRYVWLNFKYGSRSKGGVAEPEST